MKIIDGFIKSSVIWTRHPKNANNYVNVKTNDHGPASGGFRGGHSLLEKSYPSKIFVIVV